MESSAHASIAAEIHELLGRAIGVPLPMRVVDWEGDVAGPDHAAAIVVRDRTALTRIMHAPGEIGLARAFVSGELDVDGDLFEVLDPLLEAMVADGGTQASRVSKRELVAAMSRLGAIRRNPPPPSVELPRRRRGLHSVRRDRASVSHHYDVGNDFYRLFLGETMTYSCGYWRTPGSGLDAAQRDKCELVSRKLELQPGQRLLDVGSGWGTMLIHAAMHHGVSGIGITLSHEQREYAQAAATRAGVGDRVEFRLVDYRNLRAEPFDAISSIGMAEHVGAAKLPVYARTLAGLLKPGGRLLNHAIASTFPPARESRGTLRDRRSFIDRYVFPDGELETMTTMNAALEGAGFEVRDVESLREHYALTLRAWVANLRANWDRAVELVGVERARVWWLYMAGSAIAFERGNISIFQTVAVRQDAEGRASLPLTRGPWLGDLLNP